MSHLLKEIKRNSRDAAAVLERADLRTDSDIKSLTRADLQDLFPGPNNFKLRRTIFDIIHKQKPVELLLKELKVFIPHEAFREALSNNGVLVDYLRMLKDMKTQMNNVQSFLDAHINVLEEFSTKQPDRESATSDPVTPHNGQPNEAPGSWTHLTPGTGDYDSTGQMVPVTGQTGGLPQGGSQGTGMWNKFCQMATLSGLTGGQTQGSQSAGTSSTSRQMTSRSGAKRRQQTGLCYRMFVSAQTFGAHLELIDKLKNQVQDQFLLFEGPQDHQITFVFCPISSRVASDVEAAMNDVKVSSGHEHVILVLMHHKRDVQYTTNTRTWRPYDNVKLHVNVFYHETMRGLLKCEQNNAAVSEIQKHLLECFG